ncbi:unnamed protein product, partial [Discosporangium mesarthrocarpum]
MFSVVPSSVRHTRRGVISPRRANSPTRCATSPRGAYPEFRSLRSTRNSGSSKNSGAGAYLYDAEGYPRGEYRHSHYHMHSPKSTKMGSETCGALHGGHSGERTADARGRETVDANRGSREEGEGGEGKKRECSYSRLTQIAEGVRWVQKHPVLSMVMWVTGMMCVPEENNHGVEAPTSVPENEDLAKASSDSSKSSISSSWSSSISSKFSSTSSTSSTSNSSSPVCPAIDCSSHKNSPRKSAGSAMSKIG